MSYGTPGRVTIRRTRIRRGRVAGLIVVVAAIVAALGHQSPATSPTTASSSTAAPPVDVPRGASDEESPGVANLDPDLLRAVRRAETEAAYDGVELRVTSGWRSAEHQERLRREAIAKYGSEAEAARWVATADASPHVSGDAVDVAPSEAAAWLSARGAEYGLCQIYANEPWHYELRPEARDHGCPPPYPDPTHDPRMQQ